MINDPGLDGRQGLDPCGQGTRSHCDWQMLSYAVENAALPLSRLVASRETSLLVHGKEVAEAD